MHNPGGVTVPGRWQTQSLQLPAPCPAQQQCHSLHTERALGRGRLKTGNVVGGWILDQDPGGEKHMLQPGLDCQDTQQHFCVGAGEGSSSYSRQEQAAMQAGRQAVLSCAACLPNISAALGPCFQHSSAPRIGRFGNEEPQGDRALQKTRPLGARAREQGSRASSAALSGPQWPYPDRGSQYIHGHRFPQAVHTGCMCSWVPRHRDGTPRQGFVLSLLGWRQARDGRAASLGQGCAGYLGFGQSHWQRWGQGLCAMGRSETSCMGFLLCPGISGYYPACPGGGWQHPGCR